jgi:hypothetical protein
MKNQSAPFLLVITLVGIFAFFYTIQSYRSQLPTPTPGPIAQASPDTTPSPAVLGLSVRTQTTDCTVNGPLPDPECTPGALFPEVTKDDVCTPGYSKSVRNVTQKTKEQVYASYGVTTRLPGQYEVDHLISLELGGSNDISNLWPEIDNPRPGYHEKDQVENYLHDQVCKGKMSLEEAQLQIAHNWLVIYQMIIQK